MSIDWSWLLVFAGAVLVLVEVLLGGFAGFDLVLIGSAFVLGGVVGLITKSPGLAYMTAALLGIAYIAVGRRLVRERLAVSHAHPSNVDAVLGQQGVVQQRVGAHEPGLVKIGSEVWRALPVQGSGPFEPGALITVAGVDGVTLQIR
jgi:membrane protein implicated in regulation of membrane protease activity